LVETKTEMIKRSGSAQVLHIKMHVSDSCALRQSGIWFSPACCRQILQIQRIDCGQDLALAGHFPLRSRTVAIHLDRDAIGICEIQRLADQMIGGSHSQTVPGGVNQEPSQVGTAGQKNREVIQSQQASPGYWPDVRLFVKRQQHYAISFRAE